jgi:hypothetical protein
MKLSGIVSVLDFVALGGSDHAVSIARSATSPSLGRCPWWHDT